jgi:hypothetical protein
MGHQQRVLYTKQQRHTDDLPQTISWGYAQDSNAVPAVKSFGQGVHDNKSNHKLQQLVQQAISGF